MSVIGTGGFGKVYKYTSGSGPQLAIKEETKVSILQCVENLLIQYHGSIH